MPEDNGGGGGGGVSKNYVKVKGEVSKNQAWHILHCTSPPLPINNDQSLIPNKAEKKKRRSCLEGLCLGDSTYMSWKKKSALLVFGFQGR